MIQIIKAGQNWAGAPLVPGEVKNFDTPTEAQLVAAGVAAYMGQEGTGLARVLWQSHVQVPTPSDTAENSMLALLVPALSQGDMLRITVLVSQPINTNIPTARLRFAGQQVYSVSPASNRAGFLFTAYIRIRAGSQLSGPLAYGTGAFSNVSDLVATSIDTSVPQVLALTLQKTAAGDAVALESVTVELLKTQAYR